jgi:hypothetical protein
MTTGLLGCPSLDCSYRSKVSDGIPLLFSLPTSAFPACWLLSGHWSAEYGGCAGLALFSFCISCWRTFDASSNCRKGAVRSDKEMMQICICMDTTSIKQPSNHLIRSHEALTSGTRDFVCFLWPHSAGKEWSCLAPHSLDTYVLPIASARTSGWGVLVPISSPVLSATSL